MDDTELINEGLLAFVTVQVFTGSRKDTKHYRVQTDVPGLAWAVAYDLTRLGDHLPAVWSRRADDAAGTAIHLTRITEDEQLQLHL